MSESIPSAVWLWQASQSYSYCYLSYLPFIFRLAALMIAFPFALFIALDAIAYGIARTLHLSMTQRRVPRSPMSANSRPLEASDSAYGEVDTKYSFDIPTPSETDDEYDLGDLSIRLNNLPSASDDPSRDNTERPSSPFLANWSAISLGPPIS